MEYRYMIMKGDVIMDKQVMEALRLIQEICQENTDCDKCPFGNSGGVCQIVDDVPSVWYLKDEQPKVYRYFKNAD